MTSSAEALAGPDDLAALDADAFSRRTELFRRELTAHCYRMTGSIDEAEDLVQETYLRAWRSRAGYQGRAGLRTWLYRIATNACLTALQGSRRRALPSGLGVPVDGIDGLVDVAGPEVSWLQPVPDALLEPTSDDPASIVAFRDSIRLALVASLQYLPPRQRAVLLLRDVLGWPAAEVAEAFGTSTAAVKSLLQRARARLEEVSPSDRQLVEPDEPRQRELLQAYVTAFETADPRILEHVLRRDACLEMTPFRGWFSGLTTCMAAVRTGMHEPGEWRMLPTRANGQPAVVSYRRDGEGTLRAAGVVVLTTTADGIARITVFSDPGLAARFAHPPELARPTS